MINMPIGFSPDPYVRYWVYQMELAGTCEIFPVSKQNKELLTAQPW